MCVFNICICCLYEIGLINYINDDELNIFLIWGGIIWFVNFIKYSENCFFFFGINVKNNYLKIKCFFSILFFLCM